MLLGPRMLNQLGRSRLTRSYAVWMSWAAAISSWEIRSGSRRSLGGDLASARVVSCAASAAGRAGAAARRRRRGKGSRRRIGLSVRVLLQFTRVFRGAPEEELDLGVEGAKLRPGPPLQGIVQRGVEAEEERLALGDGHPAVQIGRASCRERV